MNPYNSYEYFMLYGVYKKYFKDLIENIIFSYLRKNKFKEWKFHTFEYFYEYDSTRGTFRNE
jgi:hypothetical protein